MDKQSKILMYVFVGFMIASIFFVYKRAFLTREFEIVPLDNQSNS
jgi:hypothetical protein